jgi:3-oxoacyl-[acyl-carrier-protein] synthase II
MTRVFVTGIGSITPVGNSLPEFWDSLTHGRSGIAKLETIPTDDLPINIGGEVRGLDFDRASVNDKVAARKLDRSSIFGVVAAGEALEHAGLPRSGLGERVSVVIGNGLAGLATLQEQTENLLGRGPRGVSPHTIPTLMPNACAANISLGYGAAGTAYSVASACSSSGHALIDAYEILRRGQADIVITGGSESPLTRLAISAFANMKAMTKKFNDNPTKASRPFDAGRDGFVMSEGATIIILETEESAKKRGAKRLAEMVGYGATMDCHHIVQPDTSGAGAVRAVKLAMAMAGWHPAEIAGRTYVNAHGTSTKFNDLMETVTLKTIFGEDARKLRISSTKSVTGHLIGAAAATETAACCMTHGLLPPTINYETPDPECDLDYIPNEPRKAECDFALNNTFGFGGHNVCLAFRKA